MARPNALLRYVLYLSISYACGIVRLTIHLSCIVPCMDDLIALITVTFDMYVKVYFLLKILPRCFSDV